ncbi:MAG: thiamine-phosphate kinase [Sphingomonadales bacterium]|nr:thiamine-phosphate kinase [Sphingomonadales bacterium]
MCADKAGSEAGFLARLQRLARHPAARGFADDCAVLAFGGETLVVTHDMMAEGVHWLPGQDEADIAWKLVATNLSDLAAKGAEPVGVLLGYALGSADTRFLEGLEAALVAFATPLLGGDTIAALGPRCLGLTALGRATHRPVPARSGARAGDGLWLTGALGAAMLGYEALRDGRGTPDETLAFRRPRPLIAEGRLLAPHVTAMMDVSDGLLLDATRLARASGVTIAIDSAAVPLAPLAPCAAALRWGDDYQLLFTLPAGRQPPVAAFAIGRVLPQGEAPLLLDGVAPAAGERLGYEHGASAPDPC